MAKQKNNNTPNIYEATFNMRIFLEQHQRILHTCTQTIQNALSESAKETPGYELNTFAKLMLDQYITLLHLHDRTINANTEYLKASKLDITRILRKVS